MCPKYVSQYQTDRYDNQNKRRTHFQSFKSGHKYDFLLNETSDKMLTKWCKQNLYYIYSFQKNDNFYCLRFVLSGIFMVCSLLVCSLPWSFAGHIPF